MEYRTSRHSNLIVEVDADLPAPIPRTPSPVEHIGLIFTFRDRRSHFLEWENGDRQLVWQREGHKVPLCDHQFPSEIFNRRDDSLFHYLSCSFQSFEDEIDAELVAHTLIERWIKIKDEVNSRSSDRVFPMTVNLTMWYVETRHEVYAGEDCKMIPACGGAVTKMLKRFEKEEDGVCVICLDELNKKKKNGGCALQMPCMHVFHGNCIEEWLNRSHFCPICRFEMPVDVDYVDYDSNFELLE